MHKTQMSLFILLLSASGCIEGSGGEETLEPGQCYLVGSNDKQDITRGIAAATGGETFELCSGLHTGPLTLQDGNNLFEPIVIKGAADGSTTITGDSTYVLAIESQQSISLSDLTLDASSASSEYGLLLVESSAVNLDSIEISGATERGLYLEGSTATASNLNIHDGGSYGILALANSTLYLSSSELSANRHTGLLAQDSDVHLEGVSISGAEGGIAADGSEIPGHGISIQKISTDGAQPSATFSQVEISNNAGLAGIFYDVELSLEAITATNNADGGFWIAESTAPTLNDIKVSASSSYGLSFRNSPNASVNDLEVQGITLGDNLTAGVIAISTEDRDEALLTLDGALISDIAGMGIYLNIGQIHLDNLEIDSVQDYGILGLKNHGDIQNSAISNVLGEIGSTYGILMGPGESQSPGEQNISFKNNVIEGTSVAIRVDAQPVEAAEDILSGNRYGYYLNDMASADIQNSQVLDSNYVAIALSNVENATFSGLQLIHSGNDDEIESGVGILSYDSNISLSNSQLESHKSAALAAHSTVQPSNGAAEATFTVTSSANNFHYNGQTGVLIDSGGSLNSSHDSFSNNGSTCVLASNTHNLSLDSLVARQCGTGLWMSGGNLQISNSEMSSHSKEGAHLIEVEGLIQSSYFAENSTGLLCEESQLTVCANTFELNGLESNGCGTLSTTCP